MRRTVTGQLRVARIVENELLHNRAIARPYPRRHHARGHTRRALTLRPGRRDRRCRWVAPQLLLHATSLFRQTRQG
jgi:hypothetical protein